MNNVMDQSYIWIYHYLLLTIISSKEKIKMENSFFIYKFSGIIIT